MDLVCIQHELTAEKIINLVTKLISHENPKKKREFNFHFIERVFSFV